MDPMLARQHTDLFTNNEKCREWAFSLYERAKYSQMQSSHLWNVVLSQANTNTKLRQSAYEMRARIWETYQAVQQLFPLAEFLSRDLFKNTSESMHFVPSFTKNPVPNLADIANLQGI